jgi:predicted metal-dependent hydrolase
VAHVSDVTFRKMRFDINESVPFQWNAANPASGLMSNVISLFAVGFERYIVLAIKDALQVIDDADLRVEAEVFLAQESQHSAAHRKHVNALVAQYPALGATLDRVIGS